MTNEDIATIIIRRPYDITLGVTNTDLYDIILLPQADGVEDGGRVITVYNGSWSAIKPSGDDSHDVYSLTLGKDDAYLAIGGNYYDNNETYCMVTAASANPLAASIPYDTAHPGPGPGALVLYDENGNPVETDYTYMVDANYNVHHLAYSVANRENGAIRFSGDKGTLVLTAQNGAKNSAEYTESKYNKYYDITIDLSEFANVKEGDTLCYSVDGGEIKKLTVGADKKVVISGDTKINANANVDWYVASSRDNRLSENEKFDIVSYAESLAGGMIGNMFESSNADCINFITALQRINDSIYANYAGGPFNLSALDEANYMWLKINGGEWQKLAVENGAVYIEGHQFNVSDTFEWYFVYETYETLTDTYTIDGIVTGLDIDLSIFDKNLVTAGCKFVYFVDGKPQEAIEITDEHLKNAVGLSGNEAIKNGSKIEWYITDANGDRLTNNRVIENVKLADVKEFSAEYRKDQLRIDVTDFIADAGSYDAYSIKYTVKYKDENGKNCADTREVAITLNSAERYVFTLDNVGADTVLDYQIFGKDDDGKVQLGENYSATIDADGKLVVDASCISAEITTSNAIVVDLTKFFVEEVTDFDNPNVTYTFGGVEVTRDINGNYVAEISGVENGGEYKLERHVTYINGSNDVNGITIVEKNDEDALISGYTYDAENGIFKLSGVTISNLDEDTYEVDITEYMSGIAAPLNIPTVTNMISYVVKDANGLETIRNMQVVCVYDTEVEAWKIRGNDSTDIKFDLAEDLLPGAVISSFDVNTYALSTSAGKYGYHYEDLSASYRGSFADSLNYYLGTTSSYYDWFKFDGLSGWWTAKELIESNPDFLGVKVVVNYEVTTKDKDGKDVTHSMSRSWDYFDDLEVVAVTNFTTEILNKLGFYTTDESGIQYDESKIKSFDIELYTTLNTGTFGKPLNSLHYADNEIAQITDYYNKREAFFDFTDYIIKNGGSADKVYTLTLKDAKGNIITDADNKKQQNITIAANADGKFILRVSGQSVGTDYTFTLKGDSINLTGTIDNVGGAGISDIFVEYCKDELYIDFNSYIKEFKAENISNRDVDLDNVKFIISIGGEEKYEFAINSNAVISIPVTDPAEVQEINITVKEDKVISNKNVTATVSLDNGSYVYDLTAAVNFFISNGINDEAEYNLWLVDGKPNPLIGESPDLIIATCKGSDLMNWFQWKDVDGEINPEQLGSGVELYITTGSDESIQRSTSVYLDNQVVYDTAENGMNFSKIFNDLKNKYVTDDNEENVFFLVENNSTKTSVVVSMDEIETALKELGNIGDVFKVSVLETGVVLNDGDVWQVSGNDTSIVSIETALNTQHIQKTDDKIALRSDSYGIFGGDFSRGIADRIIYESSTEYYTLPGDTKNYTIWAENKLVVESDLAGIIETNTNAINFGYKAVENGKIATHDDSRNRTVTGISVKAQNLELMNNFRADIDNRNTSETMAIAQEYSGENVYDADGNLISFGDYEKTFRVGTSTQDTPANDTYSAGTIFTYIDKDGKQAQADVSKASLIWVYDGVLYTKGEDGKVSVIGAGGDSGSQVKTLGSYEDIFYSDNAVFDANTDYAINPSERWVYKDGGWQRDDSMSFNTRIILEAGKDYEVGELIYGDKDLGYGIPMSYYDWSDTGLRQIERNEYDAEGNLQKVIYVYYTYDFYGYNLLEYKTSEYINGTWITAYAHGANNASGNTVDDIGIAVSGNLTQKSGIWAGNISVETDDVYIAAHADYLAPSTEDVKRAADQADASNNKIGAYGLKVDGTADINKIDKVALDNDGTSDEVKYQDPVITAVANNNKIEAYSESDSDTPDWSKIANSTITAAAIHAGTLKIDTVTENATFSASATNNTLDVNLYKEDHVAGSGVKAYGIYANNATFRDFDGNIKVEWLNNDTFGVSDVSAGIYVTSSLTSNCNLNGNIEVNTEALGHGIYSGGTITVKGVIDTDIYVYDTNPAELAGFGLNAESVITAAGFTGNINATVGINASSIVSNISNDSFDIAGELTVGYAFVSLNTINLRVSGTIVSEMSIMGEINYSLDADNKITMIHNTVANKDYVELTGTANVTGDIDLRKGINNYSISSNATLVGNILDSAGQANIVYHLEGNPADGHITHTINSYDDQTIFSTNTITLNVNYAEIGKNYQLIKYELADGDAEKYWQNREVAIMYQGQTVTFKLSKVEEQLIPDDLIGECEANADDVQVITIDEVLAGKGFTFPQTSGIQFGIEYYLLDAEGEKTGIGGYTTTKNGADGKRFFTVSGVAEGQKIGYTIVSDGENHRYYIGSTTFKDANGNDVTITGTFATDTDIFSVELSGENVSLAPEVPEVRFEALAKGEKAPEKTIITKSSYDEKNDALTLSWNHQTATQYGLVEIYAYEVEYTVFDQKGDAISSSIATRVVGNNKLTINGIDENMFVKWRIRLLGSSSASMSSGWSEWETDRSAVKPEITPDGDAVLLEYDKDAQTITMLAPKASTVNYTIFDVNGQTTNLKDAVMIEVEEGVYKLVIENVAADSEFRYQIAECLRTCEYTQNAEKEGEEDKIIQEVVGWQSLYSDSYHIADLNDMTDQTLISFDYSNFSSKVIDANYNERANVGVIGSIANITFESLESAVQVRNYIIEYCPVTEQVTLDNVKESGAVSIDDYIANYLDKIAANNGAKIYSKTFTGTSLDISEIQNQTYVYWRIKAVDVNGYTSDWIAGDTFRVWANAEGDKFAPTFNELKYGVVGLDYNPAASDNFENRTQLEGYIGWTKAEDSDSGVKNYVIEFTTQSSEKIVKTIGAEYNTPASVGSYKIDKNAYKDGDVFTIEFVESDGKEMVNAKVSEVIDEETGEITGYILTWEKIDFKYDGKVTIYKGEGEDKAVFLANLVSGENGYTATVYDYLFDFNGLEGSSYSYTIYAVDYFGNMSAKYSDKFSVDNGNPTNLTTTVRTVVSDDDVTCSIYWSEAADDNELGVRYYKVRYREVGTSEWIESKIASGNCIVNEGDKGFIEGFKYMFSFNLDSNEQKTYEYEVIAYDYFENSTTVTGKFGSVDIAPPTGFFKPDEFKSTVDAVYKTVTVEKEVVDSEGNTTTVTETITGALDYATVKLSWDGEFADQSQLRYVIEVSDDKYFKSANTYSFWTDGSEKSMTFDNSTPGRPVGIFEGMSTVYWRVTVADEYFNTSVLSTTQSFSFTDAETGNAIVTTEKPSAPYGLTIKNDEKEDGVLTGKNISLTWRSANELLGVYSYKIELVNSAGKVVGSYSTVDKSGLQSTDINEIVKVVKTDNYSEMHIVNLNQIFAGGDKLTDGTYTVRVSAVDGNGRVSEAGETQFVQDTTAPKIAVNQIDWYLLPAGTNQTGTSVVEFMMDWTKAAKAGGSKDIVRYEVWQTTDDPAADGAKWEKIVEVEDTRYSALLPANVKDTYYYKIVAYDASGNRSSDDLWNANNVLEFTPANAKDSYSGNFAPATLLEFDNGRSIMPKKDYELVGRGDEDCIYFTTKNNPEALTLTANQLETVYDAASDVKVEIYKGLNNLWKTYTVSGEGKVFNDLLLDANTSYYVRISSVKYDSVVAYNFVWDKAAVGGNGYNTTDNTAVKALTLEVGDDGETVTDWVGYDDSVDYKKLEISGSGKYNITLSNVAKSVTLVLVERTANANGTYSEKAISTITAKDSDLNGKTISNALLDAGKDYYLKVTAGNANDIGTTYDVTVEPVKPLFEKPTTEDDVRSKALALWDTKNDKTKSGWVGYGDATDFYRLEVGENGGAYNFTIEHEGAESEAVKLVVYELTGENKYRTVKTVTLAKNAASISTGELYLTGANGGTYYVEVTATGAAKAKNSHYKVTADGYTLPSDTDGTSLDNMDVLSNGETGWVGVGDNADYYYIDATNIGVDGYYTLTLDGINGNQIKAAIGYENPKGTFVALQTVTGAANSENLMLSRKFTQADLDKLALSVDGNNNKLIVKIFAANTTSANSNYTVSWDLNVIYNGDDALTKGKAFVSAEDSFGSISVGGCETGWVGLGDAADYRIVSIGSDDSGYYSFNLSGVENNLTVDLYEVKLDVNGNILSSAKVSSASATTSADGKLFWALDAGKYYAVGVTNAGASKGLNSDYELEFDKVSALSNGEKTVSAAEPQAYVFEVGSDNAGVRSFELDDIEGGQVKVSIYNAATNKLVTSFTSKAGADYMSFSYNFAEGSYMHKVEAADKNGMPKSFDLTCKVLPGDNSDDVIIGKATKDNSWATLNTNPDGIDGWVGLSDATDFIRLDLNETGTGSYNIKIDELDNKAVLSLMEVTAWNADGTVKTSKTVKSVTATAANGNGLLENMLLDSTKTYFVQVKASSATGTGDSNYELSLTQNEKFVIKTDDDGEFNSSLVVKGVDEKAWSETVKGWVGFGDAKDCIEFGTDNDGNLYDVANISVSLGDYTGTGDVKVEIVQYNATTDKQTVVKTVTLSSKATAVNLGNMFLTADCQYSIRVTATKAASGVNANYEVTVNQYNLSDFESGNNLVSTSQEWDMTTPIESAVWLTSSKAGDNIDFYTITVEEGKEGNYTFDLTGISGNNIKISIGVENPKGAFKSQQSITGVAGSDEFILARNLAAGTYLVKVETTGTNKSSSYTLSATRNEDRLGFNTGDDTWKQVADDTESKSWKVGETIENWVGLGDANDVFKIRLDANGQVTFECDDELQEAIAGKGVAVTLLDSTGKSVALTYDSAEGVYTSKNILCAGCDYYLNVINSNTAKFSVDYEITIS